MVPRSAPGEENRLNYARRSCLVYTIIPRYMALVFSWLYVGRSQDLCSYLESQALLSKRFDKNEKAFIKSGVNATDMDTKMLYKLLQCACGLAKEDKLWYSSVKPNMEPSLEQMLYQLKQIRNTSSHMTPNELIKVSDAELDELASELRKLLGRVLTMAGEKAGKSKTDITKAVSKMEREVHEERYSESCITVEQFIIWSRQELMMNWNKSVANYVEPRFVVENQDSSLGSVFPLRDLFNQTFEDRSQPRVLLVTGEAGAGKTSLCRVVLERWLGDAGTHDDARHQLLLFIECANVNSGDLHRHLRTWTLPNTTKLCDDAAALTRLLRQLKVLWLLDGWDEATKEAKTLLQELIQFRPESHTILVTSRPELSASLSDLFLEKEIFKVSFVGLNDDEKKEFIRKMQVNRRGENSSENFISVMNNFDSEVSRDLNNPLRLRLMAEQCFFILDLKGGLRSLPLSWIYKSRIQWQRGDLIKRCKKDAAPGHNVEQMVDDWLRFLYQESFKSVKSGPQLSFSSESEALLNKLCDGRAKQFVSTFLECVPGREISRGGSKYTFSHNTQRCVYAALHLDCCCLGVADAQRTIREVLEADFAVLDDHLDPYLGIYDIPIQLLNVARILLSKVTFGRICYQMRDGKLFEVLAHLGKKCVHLITCSHLPTENWVRLSAARSRLIPVLLHVMEMWAIGCFKASVSGSFLGDIFARCLGDNRDPVLWFEMVQRCGQHPDIMKQMSRNVDKKSWIIHDDNLQVVRILLKYVAPEEVKVIILGDPQNLPHLKELLSELTKWPLWVGLYLLKHFLVHSSKSSTKDLSDDYLKLLCQNDSKCRLRRFSGHLSKDGLQILGAAPYLQELHVRITQPAAVHRIITQFQGLSCLELLSIIYDNKNFIAPSSSLTGSLNSVVANVTHEILQLFGLKPIVHLHLPRLCIASVNMAIDFISGLSRSYDHLHVGKLDERGVKMLVAGLGRNGVRVKEMTKLVYAGNYRHKKKNQKMSD